MNHQVDAREKACPIPVVMAKNEVDSGRKIFSVLVDNHTAVENLKRFGNNSGYQTTILEKESGFEIIFEKFKDCSDKIFSQDIKSWAVFIGREGIGDGDIELGVSLMKMFFYALTQDGNIPKYILFMNAGVKIPTDNEQVIEHLKEMQQMGAEILVCGACLNFYEITDKLKVGIVSNMYDIAGAMKVVDKVVSF